MRKSVPMIIQKKAMTMKNIRLNGIAIRYVHEIANKTHKQRQKNIVFSNESQCESRHMSFINAILRFSRYNN